MKAVMLATAMVIAPLRGCGGDAEPVPDAPELQCEPVGMRYGQVSMGMNSEEFFQAVKSAPLDDVARAMLED